MVTGFLDELDEPVAAAGAFVAVEQVEGEGADVVVLPVGPMHGRLRADEGLSPCDARSGRRVRGSGSHRRRGRAHPRRGRECAPSARSRQWRSPRRAACRRRIRRGTARPGRSHSPQWKPLSSDVASSASDPLREAPVAAPRRRGPARPAARPSAACSGTAARARAGRRSTGTGPGQSVTAASPQPAELRQHVADAVRRFRPDRPRGLAGTKARRLPSRAVRRPVAR